MDNVTEGGAALEVEFASLNLKHFWKSGNFLSKSDLPTDLSKRLKKDPSAPTLTLISELAVTHGCGFVMEVVDAVKSAEASKFRDTLAEAMPCSAFSPTTICGMTWAVASNVEPMSASGFVVIVTWLALGVIPSEFDPSWGGKSKEAPLRS